MELGITKNAFWDTNFEDLRDQEDTYADFIIKRVAQYGTFEDMLETLRFYGDDKVRSVIDTMSIVERDKSKLQIALLACSDE